MMKKAYNKILIFCVISLCLTFFTLGCNLFNSDNETIEKRIGVGEIVDCVATKTFPNAVIVSSNEAVIKVISHKYITDPDSRLIYTIQGIKEGSATISIFNENGKKLMDDCKYVVKYEKPVHLGKGNLVSKIEMDKTTAEVYRDDTLITYTVTTSIDVDKLELTQVSHVYQKYFFDDLIRESAREDFKMVLELNKLIIDQSSLTNEIISNENDGTRYCATRVVNENNAIWTVKWDMGDTAVRFVRINAFDTSTNTTQTNYVKLNITYPVITTEDGFGEIIKLFVKYNLTEPLIFKTDSPTPPNYDAEIDTFRNLNNNNFSNRFNDTTIYGGNSVSYITRYSTFRNYSIYDFVDSVTGEKIRTEFFGNRVILCDSSLQGYINTFYEPITDELRAVIAYKNNLEIDENLFPYAHSILENASAVLEEIITDEMTDFEKEKAIYTWMYEKGVKGSTDGWTPITEGVNEQNATKTAYGLLNNYSGDCMAWSSTFYTLCNMAGLDCVVVDVKSTAGGAVETIVNNHRINMIKIDGEYYFVDAFWSWQKTDPSDGTYRYMNMGTEKASMHYTWLTEEKGGPFVCNFENYLVDEQTGELLNK